MVTVICVRELGSPIEVFYELGGVYEIRASFAGTCPTAFRILPEGAPCY